MKTYEEINTTSMETQLKKETLTMQTVMSAYSITEQTYEDLLWEAGLVFVQGVCRDWKSLSQDPQSPYWSWWRTRWQNDDERILNDPTGGTYEELKAELLESDQLKKHFQIAFNGLQG